MYNKISFGNIMDVDVDVVVELLLLLLLHAKYNQYNFVIFCNDAVDWGCCHMFSTHFAVRTYKFICNMYIDGNFSVTRNGTGWWKLLLSDFHLHLDLPEFTRQVTILLHTINARLTLDYLLVKSSFDCFSFVV